LSVICWLTVPTTTRKTFSQPEGSFVFPTDGESYFPYHSCIITIQADRHTLMRLTIAHNVAQCDKCLCDRIEVHLATKPDISVKCLCGGCIMSPRTSSLCSQLSSAHALGASVVWHLLLPLMNSFNKPEAAVFSFGPCFLRATLSSV